MGCPTLHRDGDCKRMEMIIYMDDNSGKNQMYAEVDFGVVNGIMRFLRPARKASTESKVSRKRKRSSGLSDDESEVVFSGGGTDAGSYTGDDFFLGANDKPTARKSIWPFRWRSQDSEGIYESGSDESLCTITFKRVKSNRLVLEGTIDFGFAGECDFTGEKIMNASAGKSLDPGAMWERFGHKYRENGG